MEMLSSFILFIVGLTLLIGKSWVAGIIIIALCLLLVIGILGISGCHTVLMLAFKDLLRNLR